MAKHSFEAFQVGEETSDTIAVGASHMAVPQALFNDNHPIHHDPEYARERGHQSPLLAGSMVSGIMTSALAAMLSESGLALLSYSVNFRAPVYEGDELTARCTVVGKEPKPARGGGLIFLKTTLHNQSGVLVAEGEAVDLVAGDPQPSGAA